MLSHNFSQFQLQSEMSAWSGKTSNYWTNTASPGGDPMGTVCNANQKTDAISLFLAGEGYKGLCLEFWPQQLGQERNPTFQEGKQKKPHPRSAPPTLVYPFVVTIKLRFCHGEMATRLQKKEHKNRRDDNENTTSKAARLYNVDIFNHKLSTWCFMKTLAFSKSRL